MRENKFHKTSESQLTAFPKSPDEHYEDNFGTYEISNEESANYNNPTQSFIDITRQTSSDSNANILGRTAQKTWPDIFFYYSEKIIPSIIKIPHLIIITFFLSLIYYILFYTHLTLLCKITYLLLIAVITIIIYYVIFFVEHNFNLEDNNKR